MIETARNPEYFTYLDDCPGRLRIELGDARQKIVHEPSGHYGLIAVDAFSSDAVPVHLLTSEALDVYLDKLTDNGIIAFHTSHRYLDLVRVLDGLARKKGLRGLFQVDTAPSNAELLLWKAPSQWVIVARNAKALQPFAADGRWQPLPGSDTSPVWTDDFSNLLDVLHFSH